MTYGLHEECGVFGVFAEESAPVAEMVYLGLYALQHRGQESCGIAVSDDGLFRQHRGDGLVQHRGGVVVDHPREQQRHAALRVDPLVDGHG